MGGFRGDGRLLESLQKAVDLLYDCGYNDISDDIEEAIVRLRDDERVTAALNDIIATAESKAREAEREQILRRFEELIAPQSELQ